MIIYYIYYQDKNGLKIKIIKNNNLGWMDIIVDNKSILLDQDNIYINDIKIK